MITHDVTQGSEEWLALRLGKLTASNFSKIITAKTRKVSAGADEYMNRLLAEWALGTPVEEQKSSPWMQRGKEEEPAARAWYAFQYDAVVATPGFCEREDLPVGCSPDGMPGPLVGLEIKVRTAPNHMAVLRGGASGIVIPQVQGSMWVTGAYSWDILHYNAYLPQHVETVGRDDEWMSAFDRVIPTFCEQLEKAKAEFLERHDGFTPRDRATCERRIDALVAANKLDKDGADELRFLLTRGNGLWVAESLNDLEVAA